MKFNLEFIYLSIFAIIANIECKHVNNVCKTFLDYYTRIFNPNCWYDPDVTAGAAAQILSHGYPLEIYEVITEDYYILQVFRIPSESEDNQGIVVLLPSAGLTTAIWTDLGNDSLAFLLHEAGYDVWMGNYRGNIYSNKHVYLSTSSNQFWNYSFHEIGLYDYPAIFDLVRSETGYKDKLYYISHSLTSTAAFVYSSLRPQHAVQNIKLFLCWAPVNYMKYTSSILYVTLSPFVNFGMFFAELFHMMNALPHNSLQNRITRFICTKIPWIIPLCAFVNDFTSGYNPDYIVPARVPLFMTQNSDGLSFKVLAHYGQIFNAGGSRFQFYDYGIRKNQYYYHSKNPPIYPIENMKVPMCLVYGGKDDVADKKDVVNFYNDMPKEAKYCLEEISQYNHLDFFLGKDVAEILYKKTLTTIAKFKDV